MQTGFTALLVQPRRIGLLYDGDRDDHRHVHDRENVQALRGVREGVTHLWLLVSVSRMSSSCRWEWGIP